MSIYSSRAVQGYGYFGQAIGAFGASAFDLFSGGPGFQGADTYNNWVGGNKWAGSADVMDIGYSPITKGILNAAATKWQAIGNSMNPEDTDYQDRVKSLMMAQIASADALAANHSITGDYNRSTTAAMINAFKQLNNLIKQIAVYQVHPPAPDAITPSGSNLSPHDDLSTGRSASTGTRSPYDEPVPQHGGSNTLLYVGLAAGALALIGGAVVWSKKSKSKVSGYRRRGRSRRH
mgnify:CR=1 FL=1